MAKLTEEKIAELKSKHGPILRQVVTPLGDIILKPPTRFAWDKFADARVDKTAPASENTRELAQGCLCEPGFTDFVSILDKLPALLQGEVYLAIAEMSGQTENYETVKL